MNRNIRRVAIINRGEAAVRFNIGVREFNAERGTDIRTIALYTDVDARSRFVREADEAYELGSATFVDRKGQVKSAYVDLSRIEKALRQTKADAVWVGWGFVPEQDKIADLCSKLGIYFIGPDGDTIRRLRDKLESKALADRVGVPAVPWGEEPFESAEQAKAQALRLGFPLIMKAAAGRGSVATRRIHSEKELAESLALCTQEAKEAFGDSRVYVESLLWGARQIEVQVVGDDAGTVWALGVRDCTVQLHHKKAIEESPSPVLTAQQDDEIRRRAATIAYAAQYRGVGTVEFLYDPKTKECFFVEINPRVQAGHAVTEAISGADIVKTQLHLALGGRLEGDPPVPTGHAIGIRLYAEDPAGEKRAKPGVVDLFRMPTGPGLRVDTGLVEGDSIDPTISLEIARVIGFGRTREEAISRVQRALREGSVVVGGGTTNKGFVLDILQREEWRKGDVDVGWLGRTVTQGEPPVRPYADLALTVAAVESYDAELAVERDQFLAWAGRGRPQVGNDLGRTVELTYQGNEYRFRVLRIGVNAYRVACGDDVVGVTLERLGPVERRISCGGKRYHASSVVQGAMQLVEIDGVPHQIMRDEGGLVRAPAPSIVVSVAVKPGDTVAVGDRLATLEAMKTETALAAPFAGQVRRVMVGSNVQVMPGTPLLMIGPPEHAHEPKKQSVRVSLAEIAQTSTAPACGSTAPLADLQCLMLGFDVDASGIKRAVSEHGVLCRDCASDDADLLRLEDQLLTIFVDIASLFRRQSGDPGEWFEARVSTKEYLFTYLRNLASKGQELPQSFVERLRHALSHYGIYDLEHTPELEEALFRIYKSHRRIQEQVPAIFSVLQRRLDNVTALRDIVGSDFPRILDRLIATTQVRFPALNDTARETRYRYVDEPALAEAHEALSQRAQEDLRYLAEQADGAEYEQRKRELVDSPALSDRKLMATAIADQGVVRQAIAEIMTRRFYRFRELDGVGISDASGHTIVGASYEHEGLKLRLLSALTRQNDLASTIGALAPLISDVPNNVEAVVDLLVWAPKANADEEALQRSAAEALAALDVNRPVRRVVFTYFCGSANDSSSDNGEETTHCFTFRQNNGEFAEEELSRGMHPLVGKRLHIWRLDNFDIERMPAREGVYLYRGVARDNPKDERLFALAEIRDVTPIRDEQGNVARLPHLEYVFMETLAALRRAQAQRKNRLYWNRVRLFVWPVLSLTSDEMNALVQRLAPAAEGLGLEAVVVRARMPHGETGEIKDSVLKISNPDGQGATVTVCDPSVDPMIPMSAYQQKLVSLRRRGMVSPFDIINMLTPAEGVQTDFPRGTFQEYDLDENNKFVPVDRAPGSNKANIVVGVIKNMTPAHPEGMQRVILLGDASRSMGALAEPECRLIIEALNLAERLDVPLEWMALSAGAKISMDSGVENMDWISLVLRRLIEFTQAGREVNVVVLGITVGAQPYWNAEATMLMHTRGILVMAGDSSMVLTGKRALDYSGGVSDVDNQGIGGYERIMGPNGQAQYFAQDVKEALQILLQYYEYSYVLPGDRFPRKLATTDPNDRDVCRSPHRREPGTDFDTIGQVFSSETNPGRKKPFDIRSVMAAVSDQDHSPLERWYGMRDAEMAVVWDTSVGGYPVCMLGLESRPMTRLGFVPADGPEVWTAGTLFPQASRKVARTVNAASGRRPLVVLANLSGFDGSPESMRNLQLEYGAEIGRAVVNFKGPIVFAVVSRYHGGAFVVFSNKLNENMEVAALEGTFASVIGGAPAAAVVFAREVKQRTEKDDRVQKLREQIASADGPEKVRLSSQLAELFKAVHSEKLGQVADEFDGIHSVQRAQEMGSVHHILPPEKLRPWVIDAVKRGMERTLAGETLLKAPW